MAHQARRLGGIRGCERTPPTAVDEFHLPLTVHYVPKQFVIGESENLEMLYKVKFQSCFACNYRSVHSTPKVCVLGQKGVYLS